MISAVMSAIPRRRTPEQRGAERDATPAPALARDSDRSGCGKPKRYAEAPAHMRLPDEDQEYPLWVGAADS